MATAFHHEEHEALEGNHDTALDTEFFTSSRFS